MKKIIYVYFILVCCGIAMAAEGDISVDSFKAYINNDKQSATWDDGELLNVVVGDNIELKLKLKNHYEQSVEVELEGELNLDTDIVRTDIVTIPEDEVGNFELDFDIPDDEDPDEYDMVLVYKYKVNDSNYRHEVEFVVDIREDYEFIEIDSFKAYVDGEVQNLDWDDDTILASPGETLQIQLKLQNNHDKDIEVKVEGILDLSEELNREKELEVPEEDDKTFVLEYYIPDGEHYGTYDLEITYEYEADNDDYKNDTVIEVSLRKAPEQRIDNEDILINLTREIAGNQILLQELSSCSNISRELTDCKGDLGMYSTIDEVNKDCRQEYKDECSKTDNLTTKLATCEGKLGEMVSLSEVDRREDEAEARGRRLQKESDNYITLIVGGGLVAYIVYERKKKRLGTEGGNEPLRGKWK